MTIHLIFRFNPDVLVHEWEGQWRIVPVMRHRLSEIDTLRLQPSGRSYRQEKRSIRTSMKAIEPVFKRPILNPNRSMDFARSIAGGSLILPAGLCSSIPRLIHPRRNVPVVITTLFVGINVWLSRVIPVMCGVWSSSMTMSRTDAAITCRLGVKRISSCIAFLYNFRSICAR